ncbi:MAG: alanine racemase [Tepidisphaeraceae bacterium]
MEAKHTLGEPRALVSRNALLHNVSVLRRAVGDGVKLCAMLKADAYGHGAAVVLDALSNFADGAAEGPFVDAVAVASIDEAAALPETSLPVLVFRPIENIFLGRQREKLELAIRSGWTLTVCTRSAADDVARIALTCGKRASVQLMVDTGMTRSGVPAEELRDLHAQVAAHASLRLQSLCTHFASGESTADPFTFEQNRRFADVTEPCIVEHAARGKTLMRHAANSGAAFLHPGTHYDMVRPGIALYGIDPTCNPSTHRLLKPALRWTAPLVQINDVRKGTPVGYGQTWHAPRDTRIGLVPVGYADGYPRLCSNQSSMIVHGKPAQVVGRVSMDLTTIDLGGIPQANVGDEVTVLDSDPLSPASAYQLAELAHTIPYELFCRIGPRVHRVAVDPTDPTPGDTHRRTSRSMADWE